VENIERQPHAAAERARDQKGAALVAPPAFHARDRGVEAAALQQLRAGGVAAADGGMRRAAAQLPLDAELEGIDRGGLVERGVDLGQRRSHGRTGLCGGSGAAHAVPVTLATWSIRHGRMPF
jgi:hypothetical protein